MLKNDYLLAKIGVDTAENEPRKEWCVAANLAIGELVPANAKAESQISPRHITLSEARSRLDRRRSLQVNSHFSAFFEIYKIFTILRRSNLKFFRKFRQKFRDFEKKKKLQNFEIFENFV